MRRAKRRHLLYGFTNLALVLSAATSACANEEVLLTLKGPMVPADEVPLTEADLAAIGFVDLVTETPWSNGEVRFTGLLMRDLLAHYRIEGRSIIARALNLYEIEIPFTDFWDHDVMLARFADGDPLTRRDKGPLWLVYPWSQSPELRTPIYRARSIWQMTEAEVLP